MEETYVTYDQASKLHKLGFPQTPIHNLVNMDFQGYCNCAIPTQNLAAKWLREMRDIYINVEAEPDVDSYGNAIRIKFDCYVIRYFEDLEVYDSRYMSDLFNHTKFNTYEEALCNGIDYALNNLLLKNGQ